MWLKNGIPFYNVVALVHNCLQTTCLHPNNSCICIPVSIFCVCGMCMCHSVDRLQSSQHTAGVNGPARVGVIFQSAGWCQLISLDLVIERSHHFHCQSLFWRIAVSSEKPAGSLMSLWLRWLPNYALCKNANCMHANLIFEGCDVYFVCLKG